jgi:hypothetical protein
MLRPHKMEENHTKKQPPSLVGGEGVSFKSHPLPAPLPSETVSQLIKDCRSTIKIFMGYPY